MPKSVALAGFSPLTLEGVKYTEADEIWTLNHAYKVDEIPRNDDGTMRITRLFEIHHKWWIRRGSIQEHLDYWEWLKEPHDFQIVMQEERDEIPSSWKYPFDEVVKASFPHLWRTVDNEEIREKYFTSSFDYMAALAALEGFERVELYGFDMRSDTEYSYQKPGASYHIGNLVGRGVDVVLPENSRLCKAKLYGYYGVPAVTLDDVARYHDYYQDKVADLMAMAGKATADYMADRNEETYEAMCYALGEMNLYRGALQFTGRFNEMDYLSRQNLDQMNVAFRRHLDKAQANANVKQGRFDAYDGDDPAEKKRLFDELQEAAAHMHANSGALQASRKLIGECDMKVGDPALILDMKMNRRAD